MNKLFSSEALDHAAKVAFFIVLSSVIPAVLSWYAGDPRWMAVAPMLNVVAAYAKKQLDLLKA